MTEPFHDLGREANNELSKEFEDQLAIMARALGWTVLCRNIDAFVLHQGQSQSRGFDVLVAVEDPQLQRREGYVIEAKRHEKPAYAAAGPEAQTLHDKVTRLNANDKFWENSRIRTSLDAPLRHGVVAHRTLDFEPDKMVERLGQVELRNKKQGLGAAVVHFLGPDVLEALAHVCRTFRPAEWFWPPMRRHDAKWAKACSPWSIASGMLVWRSTDGTEGMWLHDGLEHGDADLLSDMLSDWGVQPSALLCSRLKPERWRLVKDEWLNVAAIQAEAPTGQLPTDVRPRTLSANLTEFDATWPAAA